jgi:hypothetical protein
MGRRRGPAPADERRMIGRALCRSALLCLPLLQLAACSGSTPGGSQGNGGSGSTGSGGSTSSGGSSGTGGGLDAGASRDSGHDTSSGACWSFADCRSGSTCTPEGQSVCGGACPIVTHPCASDSDCASDGAVPLICVVEPCVCGSTNLGCLAGCSADKDCGPGETCGANHHCAPTPCGAAGQTCPADFACGTNGTCARKGCSIDSQCSNACVEGQCYDRPGHCQIEAP